jgi:hypothetical protein
MKLHISATRRPKNAAIIEKVFDGFPEDISVALDQSDGADFFVVEQNDNGKREVVSLAVPAAWLRQAGMGKKLEAAAVSFASYVAAWITNARVSSADPHRQ